MHCALSKAGYTSCKIDRYLLLSWVIGETYSAYGVVGSLMGVMLWYYYASAVVFLGAEFVRALSEETRDSCRTRLDS